MSVGRLLSWGRFPRHPQLSHPIYWQSDVPRALAQYNNALPTLAYGCGRSYGDSCLAASDEVLLMSGLNRLVAANWDTGVVQAEAGLTLAELIRIALPHGWFPPVVPGTRHVTLGGAVANDVHGKNHHRVGTFGRHVRSLTLCRSDAGPMIVSPTQHPDVFGATIGGLGLSGIILTVELQLRRLRSAHMSERRIRFRGLDEFFALVAQHDQNHEYTVAWIDCLARGRQFARGHYIVGNHCEDDDLRCGSSRRLAMPVDPPFSLINRATLRPFNAAIFHKQWRRDVSRRVSYERFLFPLDNVAHWNRIYGRAGFQQFQCVVPQARAKDAIGALLNVVASGGTGSFLAVLKQCGQLESPGLLSFPMAGVSLALDFPQSDSNVPLFERLDALVGDAGGRLYPAKDAHMRAARFQQDYPNWRQVEALRDPRLLSRFWRRVTQ